MCSHLIAFRSHIFTGYRGTACGHIEHLHGHCRPDRSVSVHECLDGCRLIHTHLDRRSGIYSDRPRMILAGELMAKNLALPIAPYGNLCVCLFALQGDRDDDRGSENLTGGAICAKQHMKASIFMWPRDTEGCRSKLHASCWPRSSPNLVNGDGRANLMSESAPVLPKFNRARAHHPSPHFFITSSLAQTMLSIVYALTLEEARERKDIVEYIEDYTKRFATAALPGNSLIDILPFLERIPHRINPWKRHGDKSFKYDTEVQVGLLNEVRQRMVRHLHIRFASHVVDREWIQGRWTRTQILLLRPHRGCGQRGADRCPGCLALWSHSVRPRLCASVAPYS